MKAQESIWEISAKGHPLVMVMTLRCNIYLSIGWQFI